MKDDEWPPQFDLFGARQARDEGMKKVASRSPEYIDGGMALIANLPNGFEATGEDIRLKCITSGLRYHHPNAHGTLIRMAVERGLLRATGKWQQPKIKNSHGRKIPIYRIHSMLQPLPPVSPTPTSPTPPASPSPTNVSTNAYLDVNGRLIHNTCGVEGCTKSPAHAIWQSLLKGNLGMYYCAEHFEQLRRRA